MNWSEFKMFLDASPVRQWNAFAYPRRYLVLSCVMLKGWEFMFENLLVVHQHLVAFVVLSLVTFLVLGSYIVNMFRFLLTIFTKLMARNHVKTRTPAKSPLKRLALFEALGQMHSLPVPGRSTEVHLRNNAEGTKQEMTF